MKMPTTIVGIFIFISSKNIFSCSGELSMKKVLYHGGGGGSGGWAGGCYLVGRPWITGS